MALIVLDAGVLIGFLDAADTHHPAAAARLQLAVDRNDDMVVPSSALAEVLVGPARRRPSAVGTVERLLDRVPVAVASIGRDEAVAAAALRAKHRSLRLSDALVVAVAVAVDADVLVTTDDRWPSRSKLGLRAALEVL